MMLKTMVRAVALIAFLTGAWLPATTSAQQTPASQDGFVPVDQLGDAREELPATPLVAAAYGIAWAAVLFYIWSVWRRLNQVERELTEVRRRLQPGAHK